MEHNDLPHSAHLTNYLETGESNRTHYDKLPGGNMHDESCAGQEGMN